MEYKMPKNPNPSKKPSSRANLDFAIQQVSHKIVEFLKRDEEPSTKVFPPRPDICLLNLEVWSRRYHVGVDYILSKLLDHYKYARRAYPSAVALGIPAKMLCGLKSREFLEDHIQRDFPSGENYRMADSDLRSKIEDFPFFSETAGGTNLDENVRRYITAIRDRRKAMDKRVKRYATRAWRGNPWR